MVVQINLEGRSLSLPKTVVKRGAVDWNSQAAVKGVLQILDGACQAKTVDEALAEVRGFTSLGHMIWAYAYLRMLHHKDPNLFYRTVMAEPSFLMPIVYTPTVGEACQKFGQLPLLPRGCYVSLADRGNLKAVLKEYADLMLPKDSAGKPQCQCIVFSDGGRILGLGDLGVWGMGIPIGKLDLYTVCAGFNPHKTMPVMIDAGCTDANGNAAKLTIRDHILYHGMKENRVKHTSKAGTEVNSAYYGEDSFIGEFMTAARDLFGRNCLLQFEDFNSNDAFPLLEEYRFLKTCACLCPDWRLRTEMEQPPRQHGEKFLTYNDDIQGTASIIVAAALGGIKLQKPECTSLLKELQGMRVLFHGAGSANLGGAQLLKAEVQMAPGSVVVTNSKGSAAETTERHGK
ncbi:NADP-dependent malic enzyme (NADP-ME) (Malic enzyme 1), partial [Durusdinium trenchii]